MAEPRPAIYDSNPKLGELRDNVLFGDVWEHSTGFASVVNQRLFC